MNLWILCILLCVAGCTGRGRYPGWGGVKITPCHETESIASSDSLTIKVDSMAVAVTLKVGGLAADSAIMRSLAEFVCSQMFFENDGKRDVHHPVYDGDFTTFIYACAREKWSEIKEQTFPPLPEDGEADSEIPSPEELTETLEKDACLSSYFIEFQKVCDTDSFVSWTCRYNLYVNATAHPSMGGAGITIRKADGVVLPYRPNDKTEPFLYK